MNPWKKIFLIYLHLPVSIFLRISERLKTIPSISHLAQPVPRQSSHLALPVTWHSQLPKTTNCLAQPATQQINHPTSHLEFPPPGDICLQTHGFAPPPHSKSWIHTWEGFKNTTFCSIQKIADDAVLTAKSSQMVAEKQTKNIQLIIFYRTAYIKI